MLKLHELLCPTCRLDHLSCSTADDDFCRSMRLLEITILGVLHANAARPIEQKSPRQCTSKYCEIGTC